MTDKQLDQVIELLELKSNREGYFITSWGRKTKEGLKLSLERILANKV